ncbi:tRNA (guanosine(37)-N1)-methyltransferase TrmD [Lachnospiraceae bacterium MD1]|uniref:tRNA (guanine-N(1)-)-methyltransferase n=1 Tax=Variimorphobacter saccharofermentans TaxID=2755051 RepID=A0A839K0P8_9FIRM|nr:tRNA (guanosine(37)-N1)-methyltransferase TrmD [Variimorphobacter saccharofermentans]MBB2183008.1 tRNA (guanosine(37)-N1)-methyltransferase TrmD [Variimorphobacter saccharofermentans]
MNFHILTLFPEMIMQSLGTSITGRAIDKGLISVNAINIRDFSDDKHKKVDDYPYGGGAGMVMQAEPVYKSYGYLVNHIKLSKENPADFKKPRVIYVTPQGSIFNQEMAKELSQEEDLIFLCGHYEGVDERVLNMIATDYISIGDYVLTGGELPAMVMIDAISRLIPGVLNNDISSEFESLQDNLLEYPQYTRPEIFMGQKVPEVLLTGHHAKIEAWRRKQSILRTYERRPDLLEKANLTEEEREYLTRLIFQKNYDIYDSK